MKDKQHVLVTGGAGYIGAHTVVELLHAGYQVTAIDSLERSEQRIVEGVRSITQKEFTFTKVNCLDAAALDQLFAANRFDAVIHFAAYKSVNESVEKPLMYYNNNVGSLLVVLETMKRHRVPDLIFSSSCTVYGQPDHIPVDETAPFKRAESPYGATKQLCERILEDMTTEGLRVVSLRYFNPIGAHPSALIGELPIGIPNNLVPYVTQTAAGVRAQLTVFGNDYATPDGSCLRDFIHVCDVATAHVKAIEFLNHLKSPTVCEVFNLGTGVGVSVLELVKKFIEVTGVKLNYKIGPRRPGDVEKVYANPHKVMQALHWKPTYDLGQSLLHAWQWEQKIRGLVN
ncbi:MAG: UDP-glucose 4-epimerase GalE [Cyclobacteriaceae bacterium]|nr:UDP-glucose 4-epimerase GalE [Cyclobacteriaceae bacterium]